MKMITIAGNIGKDAVVRRTQGGDAVASWTVAVEDRQSKSTIWFDCSMWGTRGEKLAEYLTKGGKVTVAGELSTREHEGKTYLTVRADHVTLMGGRPETRDEPRQERPRGRGPGMDDAIPFAPETR